jgi:cell division protein FtsB
MNQEGAWLSILEYANIKKTSISTIRRAIKAGHVKYKEENGKYLIWIKKDIELQKQKEELSLKLENEFLKKKNRELHEEIEDLKMLLSVYENQEQSLPPLPVIEL